MLEAGKTRQAPLVLILSAGGRSDRLDLARPDDTDIHFINVSSGYEAAAEMLARPVCVLVIDLAHLAGRHERLLEIASQLKVPVVAFGTITGVLDGALMKDVHLVGREKVKQVVEKIISEKPSKAPANDAEATIESTVKPSILKE